MQSDYEVTSFPHRGRRCDGTAVLTRRRRFEVLQKLPVPIKNDFGVPTMVCTSVVARDRSTGTTLILLSVHLTPHMSESVAHIRFVQACLTVSSRDACDSMPACDTAVIGGDFNKTFRIGEALIGFQRVPGGLPTHQQQQIDYIFFSSRSSIAPRSPVYQWSSIAPRSSIAPEQTFAPWFLQGAQLLRGSRCTRLPNISIEATRRVLSTGHLASDHVGEAVLLQYTTDDL